MPTADTRGRPELVIGLVTPVGTRTSDVASEVRTSLHEFGYRSTIIHLSENFPGDAPPPDELYDIRVRRLMTAGNDLCEANQATAGDQGRATMARLAVREIRRKRVLLNKQDGAAGSTRELAERSRDATAYVIHSLKRPHEVELLREVYGDHFFLLGAQESQTLRLADLRTRPLSGESDEQRLATASELMRVDADDSAFYGQRINKTYPLADYFLSAGEPRRFFEVLFGQPVAPTVDEYAMYVARAASGRSLAASRKVGAALVRDNSLIAIGYNDVPEGQTPDVLAGRDTSEMFKQANVRDTLELLDRAQLLAPGLNMTDAGVAALTALKGGQLMDVIEYQRAVHAEARCLDDALIRGISPVDGRLFVTTYPCHLCYKHILSARVAEVRYIEPYPKSRAEQMYPDSEHGELRPYEGTAPSKYNQLFVERAAFLSDADGKFVTSNAKEAHPRLEMILDDERRSAAERLVEAELTI